MPHFKCVACKTRLYSAASPPDPVGDLCPECGSLLEPVASVSELVGFRSIRSRDGESAAEAPGTHQQIADRVDTFLTRRHAILVQAHLDAERWVDEGGRFRAEAASVAALRPEPSS